MLGRDRSGGGGPVHADTARGLHQPQRGLGSALSIVLMLVLLVLTVIYLWVTKGTAGAEEV